MQAIDEYDRPSPQVFQNEIYPKARPAIMRGVGAELEPVKLVRQSPEAFAEYLKAEIGDRPVNVLAARPDAGPTFFFEDGISALNFERGKLPFPKFVEHVLGPSSDARMLYIESTPVADLSPSLARALHLPIVPPSIQPRIWMGNRTGTQTHFDVQQNIAYCVGGKRRFTLFPPDQTPNLYMVPFESSPSGAPVSLVRIEDPDFERFPKFREALEHAMVAELEPGDALFIPYLWWHHVKALGTFNVLVNYWWNEHAWMGNPVDAMLHAILVLRDLPPPMRDAWRTMFETFVFKAHGEPMDYLDPAERGGMGAFDEAMRMQLWQSLGTGLDPIMKRAFDPKFRR